MIRLGTWATVVAGAVIVVNISAAAQEQAAAPGAEQTVDSAVQPSADPPAPPADDPPAQRVVVEEPAPPAAESPAPPAAEAPAPAVVESPAPPAAEAPAPAVVESPAPPAAEAPAPAVVESPAPPAAEPPAPAAVAPPEAPAAEAAAPPAEEEAKAEEGEPEAEEEAPPVEEVPPAPPVAQFVDINDAIPGRFFDAKNTAPSVDDPNRLVIAFHSGIDWNTWKNTEFRASTEAFSYPAAMDTISFRIEAPEGFYIARVTYSQGGRGSILRTGRAAGTAQWVVGSFAAPLAQFGTTPALKSEADLTGLGLTSVPVSITNGLFAFTAPSAGSAIVEVNAAEVQVYLEALPNP